VSALDGPSTTLDIWAYAIGTANLGATPVYAYVGQRLLQRPVPNAARLPAVQFSLWWVGLGVGSLISGLEGVAAGMGWLAFPAAYTAYLLSLLVDTALLWGLVGYLLYIYTGKYHLFELSAFYAVFYVAAIYYVIGREPYAVVLSAGIPTILYHLNSSGPVFGFVAFGLLVPEIVASILYLSLLRRTTDRTRRYRIAMVSVSLWMYFVLAFAGSPSSIPAAETFGLVKALLEVVAALVSLFAFFPPELLQRWLRVEAVPVTERGSQGAAW
jgi:hypothetical protein